MRTRFHVIRTTVSTEEGTDHINDDRLTLRTQELVDAGKQGYELKSTITIPSGQFITIVDTLQKTVED